MRRGSFVWPAFAVLVFLGVTASLTAHHALWRDEWQAWLIGRDAPTFAAVLHQAHYEGAPPLWQSLLWLLNRIGAGPGVMQAFHVGLATLLIVLFWVAAPFRPLEKVLLSFGYYFLYEYAVIARGYLPGIFCLFAACALFVRRPTRATPAIALLGIAAWTSVHALLASLGPALAIALAARRRRVPVRAALVVYAVALAVAAIMMIPFPDTLFPMTAPWVFYGSAARAHDLVLALIRAIAPIPQLQVHFWNSLWLEPLGLAPLAVLGVAWLAWALALFRRRPIGRVAFGVSAFALLLFFYAKYAGAARHSGFLWVSWLCALWLDSGDPDSQTSPLNRPSFRAVFLGLLGLHVMAAGIAVTEAWRHPFSNGEAAAAWLRAHHADQDCIAAAPDYAGTSLAGALNTFVYFPQGNRWGSFVTWDRRRVEWLTEDDELTRAVTAARAARRPLLLARNQPLSDAAQRRWRATLLASFTGAVIIDENYYLYRVLTTKDT